MAYIAQISIPEASTPRPRAVLPLATTCAWRALVAGTRNLKSRFVSAQ